MVLCEFSVFPLGKGESVSAYVARCLEIIDASGLNYQLHAMGTLIEGEYEAVMEVVGRCFRSLAADCDRVECSLKFDYRKGHEGSLAGKVASVERKVGRRLRT